MVSLAVLLSAFSVAAKKPLPPEALPYEPPTILSVTPRGGMAGSDLTLTIEGEHLRVGAELISDLASVVTALDDEPPVENGVEVSVERLRFRLSLNANEAPGLRTLRLRTSRGLSNPAVFVVGSLPETPEQEPNETMAEATAAEWPATLCGQLTAADRDTFRVQVSAGDRLVFDLEAARIGSSVDASLRLLDGAGRELAFSENEPGIHPDARISHRFKAAGDCYIQVHDALYAERDPDYYRLRVGKLLYADAAFPLGGRAGTLTEILLDGGTLPAPKVTRLRFPDVPFERTTSLTLPPELGASVPFTLRVGELPEALEPVRRDAAMLVPLGASTTMNGRLDHAAEVDRYTLDAVPGETLLLQVEAAALGSWLDAVLTVETPDGRVLATADDSGGPDPRLEFVVPEGCARLLISVEDRHKRGGRQFAYRLTTRPHEPDFRLRLRTTKVHLPVGGTACIQIGCERRGYDGAVDLFLADVPHGFEVRGGQILPGQGQGCLTLTGPESATPRYLELELLGKGGTPEVPLLRQAHARIPLGGGQGAAAVTLESGAALAAVTGRPRIIVELERDLVEVPIGGKVELAAHLHGVHGIKGRMYLAGLVAPPGVQVKEKRVMEPSPQQSFEIEASPDAKPVEGDAVLVLRYEERDDDTRVVPAPAIRIRVVEPPPGETARAF